MLALVAVIVALSNLVLASPASAGPLDVCEYPGGVLMACELPDGSQYRSQNGTTQTDVRIFPRQEDAKQITSKTFTHSPGSKTIPGRLLYRAGPVSAGMFALDLFSLIADPPEIMACPGNLQDPDWCLEEPPADPLAQPPSASAPAVKIPDAVAKDLPLGKSLPAMSVGESTVAPTGCVSTIDSFSFAGDTFTYTLSTKPIGSTWTAAECAQLAGSSFTSMRASCKVVEVFKPTSSYAAPVGSVKDVAKGFGGTGTRTINPCGELPGTTTGAVRYALTQVRTVVESTSRTTAVMPALQTWFNPAYDEARMGYMTVSKECKTADGTLVTVSKRGPTNVAALPVVGCPAGSVPVSVESTLQQPGQPSRSLGKVGVDPQAQADYSACLGAGSKGCDMWVEQGGSMCKAGGAGCVDWATAAQKNPENYSCRWGPYTLAAADCEPLRHSYVTQHGSVLTTANATTAVPAVDAAGTPWPADSPYPGQQPAPGTSPSTGTAPETTTGGLPLSGTNGAPYSGTDPALAPDSRTRQCFDDNWTWNPFSWVFTPVKCAMQWAFVPRSSVLIKHLEGLRTTQTGKALDQWIASINSFGAAFEVSGSSCLGPALDLPEKLGGTLYPASTCEEPMKSLAMILRTGMSGLLIIAGVLSCIRLLTSGVGYQAGP